MNKNHSFQSWFGRKIQYEYSWSLKFAQKSKLAIIMKTLLIFVRKLGKIFFMGRKSFKIWKKYLPLFRRLYLESIFNFVLPIMYLATKKDLRRFLKILIDNIFQSTVKPCFLLTLRPRKIVPQVSESANCET